MHPVKNGGITPTRGAHLGNSTKETYGYLMNSVTKIDKNALNIKESD